jgi:hypothetical protein
MMKVTAKPGYEADGIETKIGGIYPMLIRLKDDYQTVGMMLNRDDIYILSTSQDSDYSAGDTYDIADTDMWEPDDRTLSLYNL